MNSKLRHIITAIRAGKDPKTGELHISEAEAEKAIRQAVGEEMLAMFPPMWVITEQPDEYARQKALGYNQGLAELRQKIKQWAAHQGEHLMTSYSANIE